MKKLQHFLRTSQGKFVATLVALIVLLFAYYFYAMSKTTSTPEEVVIQETDHVLGSKDARLTLVEFGDFQCPACAAYEPIVKEVLKNNAKDVKFVFRHFPLTQIHQNALLAAKASEAAALQGKFWEMHDLLYEKQENWSGALNARDLFISYATLLKLDIPKFTADLQSQAIEDKILAEYKEGIKLKVQGTPTFFLNGKKLQNPTSFEAFDKLIKDTLLEPTVNN